VFISRDSTRDEVEVVREHQFIGVEPLMVAVDQNRRDKKVEPRRPRTETMTNENEDVAKTCRVKEKREKAGKVTIRKLSPADVIVVQQANPKRRDLEAERRRAGRTSMVQKRVVIIVAVIVRHLEAEKRRRLNECDLARSLPPDPAQNPNGGQERAQLGKNAIRDRIPDLVVN